MIDWLTLRVVADGLQVRAGHVQSISPDGVIEWRVEKRMPVQGSHEATVMIRRSPVDQWLEISGNPSKFLQGHNLFGTEDLDTLVPVFVGAVFDRLDYKPTQDELQKLQEGIVTLTRIDINRNSDFSSASRALAAIRAMSECGHLSHRGRGSLVAEGTVIWGKGSRRWNLKMYAKAQELKAHPLPRRLSGTDALEAYAAGLVRQEVTVRALELKERKLDLLANWLTLGVSPRDLFLGLMGKLEISEATMSESPEQTLLPLKLRAVHSMWIAGHDLRELYPRTSFYRYRKQLLAHGIDIAVKRPARKASNVIPLRVTLVGKEVGVPDWARDTPLYFDPPAIAPRLYPVVRDGVSALVEAGAMTEAERSQAVEVAYAKREKLQGAKTAVAA